DDPPVVGRACSRNRSPVTSPVELSARFARSNSALASALQCARRLRDGRRSDREIPVLRQAPGARVRRTFAAAELLHPVKPKPDLTGAPVRSAGRVRARFDKLRAGSAPR